MGIRRTYSRFFIPGSPRESCGRKEVRLGFCSTPYQRLWLYNGALLVAFFDTLGIRRTYSRLKPPAPSRGQKRSKMPQSINGQDGNLGFPISPKNKSKIEKVPRGIRGEKSSKDMASSRNSVSTIGALASPKIGDGTRCPEG